MTPLEREALGLHELAAATDAAIGPLPLTAEATTRWRELSGRMRNEKARGCSHGQVNHPRLNLIGTKRSNLDE